MLTLSKIQQKDTEAVDFGDCLSNVYSPLRPSRQLWLQGKSIPLVGDWIGKPLTNGSGEKGCWGLIPCSSEWASGSFFFFLVLHWWYCLWITCLELLHPVHYQPEHGADPHGDTRLRKSQGNGARVDGLRQLKICPTVSRLPVLEANGFLCHLSQFELGFSEVANKIIWYAFTNSSSHKKMHFLSVMIVTCNTTNISWHLH